MANGGISPSGRILRWWLVRLPVGATRLAVARNTAAATEEGRRVMALAAFGFWVAVFWFAAGWLYRTIGVVVPLQIASLLGLLLIWRIIGLLRRWWVHRHNLPAMAVSVKRQREIYEMQEQALELLRQGVRQAIPGGGYTVPGGFRHHDPVAAEQDRMTQEAQAYVRRQDDDVNLLGPQADMPMGDKFEPTFRWLWRRREPK
jgi:hypothetical protein